MKRLWNSKKTGALVTTSKLPPVNLKDFEVEARIGVMQKSIILYTVKLLR